MKNLLSILLVSIILIGCSEESDTLQPSTNLDSNLFGVWTCNEFISCCDFTWSLTFLENGSFTTYFTNTDTNIQEDLESGTWIVQNQSLFLDWTDPTITDNGNIPYIIQGSTLTLDVTNSDVWEEEGMSIFSRQ